MPQPPVAPQSPVAIVTGASGGLGRALALELARQGYAVGVLARRDEALRTVVEEIEGQGGRAAAAMADVTDRSELAAAIHRLRDQLGPIELAVANAGIGRNDRLEPFDAQIVERTFAVNVLGAINTIGAVLPEMLERGSGHIVGISSLGADRGMPGSAAYTASKAALSTYLEGLRLALKPRGIAVTTVCPGFIRTEMTASNDFTMPWLLEPDEAACRIVRALRQRPAVYRFPLGMSFITRVLSILPDWALTRLLPAPPPKSSASPDR